MNRPEKLLGVRRGEDGYAMLIVTVFTVVTFATISGSYELLQQLFVYEEATDRVPAASDGLQEALGYGLARLATGEPTVNGSNRYICDLKMRDENGDLVKYRLIYKKLSNNRWWLRARPAAATKPDCPTTFTDFTCPAPL